MNTSKGQASTGTVKLDVDLEEHPDGNPRVLISDRKKQVTAGSKIMWSRVGGQPTFKITDFQEKATPFDNVDVKDQHIECYFKPSAADPAGTEYEYTIAVTDNEGKTHTSDIQTINPAGGLAVIRN